MFSVSLCCFINKYGAWGRPLSFKNIKKELKSCRLWINKTSTFTRARGAMPPAYPMYFALCKKKKNESTPRAYLSFIEERVSYKKDFLALTTSRWCQLTLPLPHYTTTHTIVAHSELLPLTKVAAPGRSSWTVFIHLLCLGHQRLAHSFASKYSSKSTSPTSRIPSDKPWECASGRWAISYAVAPSTKEADAYQSEPTWSIGTILVSSRHTEAWYGPPNLPPDRRRNKRTSHLVAHVKIFCPRSKVCVAGPST